MDKFVVWDYFMAILKKQVQHIASLARLKLTGPEIKKYQKQVSKILGYVGQLKKVRTKNVPPCTGGTELKNVLREDEASQSGEETREKLIKAAPLREEDLIKTRGVFKK